MQGIGFSIIITACLLYVITGYSQQPLPLDSLFKHAGQLRINGEFDKAIVVYTQCVAMVKDEKDTLKWGNATIGIGIANDQRGRYEEALQYYFEALSLYESIHQQIKIGGTLKNIGNIYRILHHYDKAFEFLRHALSVLSEQKDSTRIANIMNDIGLVYYDQDSSAQALKYFTKILTRFDKHITEEIKANVMNNAGLSCVKLKLYSEAKEHYHQSLALMEKREDQYGISLVLCNMGDLYFKTNDYHKALEYDRHSLTIAQQIESDELLLNCYENIKQVYLALEDYPNAYNYQQEELQLKAKIFKKESALKYEEMQAKYQFIEKQKEILQLQHEKEITSIALTTQKRTKYLLLTGIILILVLAVTIYRNYRLKRKANNELNLLNNKLAEANNSKTKLLSIISHDLRSPISSLFHFLELQKLNTNKLGLEERDESSRKISESAENLLDAMEDILIWSKSQMDHFKPLEEDINASELLDEIISLHEQQAADKKIILKKKTEADFNFNTDPNFIKIILRNLTNNAIKFTPAGGIVQLAAILNDNSVTLIVNDNGPGMEEGDLQNIFEWNSIRSDSSGLGLRLALEFTEKLKGKISVSKRTGGGTEFIVILPVYPEDHDA